MRTVLAGFLVIAAVSLQAQNSDADRPLESTKKNIRVLRGVPTSQLIPIMTVMANSLGVSCAHCHEKEWDSDGKPAKAAARRMLQMTRSINEQSFDGKVVVTCYTCHHGEVTPLSVPDVMSAGWSHPRASARATVQLPDAESLFAKQVAALGNPGAVTKRVTRGVATAASGRADPRSGPFELTQDRPDQVALDTEVPYPPEANRELMSQFFSGPILRTRYAGVETVGVE
jgi:hypothetical protein